MKIKKMNFPEASVLYPGHEQYDYIDSFGGFFNDKNNEIGIDEVTAAFLKPLPRWADSLMALRNRIVWLVGLKRSKKSYGEITREHFTKDGKIGFFNVYEKRDNEIILGEDDKHLNFRISIFLSRNESNPVKKTVVVTTVVTFNNWMGPVYFFFVKPFHKRIVPAMLKKDFSQFNNSVSQ
jgi:hypothetical protein